MQKCRVSIPALSNTANNRRSAGPSAAPNMRSEIARVADCGTAWEGSAVATETTRGRVARVGGRGTKGTPMEPRVGFGENLARMPYARVSPFDGSDLSLTDFR